MKKKDKIKSSVTDLLTDIEKKKGIEITIVTGDTGYRLLKEMYFDPIDALEDNPLDMFKKHGVTEIVKGSKKFKI
ncbi:MAG: hypothetical protein KA270_02840 [Saprospiraceae bacterium]|nr:hypothetical protein [Saprospiraceae bacterium]